MNRVQHLQRLRTARVDDRTTKKAVKARGAIRHNHTAIQRADTTTMGAPCQRVQNPANIGKPAGVGEALRPQGKGGSPTLRHQRSSRADTANPTDIAPPQEQDRHKEPERVRNPLRVTCGRICRGKPQAPQEEAQKQTPVRGSTNAYPAQSRRREGRHSSAASEITHRNTQGQPRRRASSKNCKASHRRRWPKRRTGRRS